MSEHVFGMLDLAIGVVAALGIGVWQLWSVNRDIAEDRARKAAQSPPPQGDGDRPA
ncbi:MAG: hypothetical protein RQ833_01235 [Sphingomonadaceae bacterium]|nr:hypothetical protein [Sphingomonadaceae bacterium]